VTLAPGLDVRPGQNHGGTLFADHVRRGLGVAAAGGTLGSDDVSWSSPRLLGRVLQAKMVMPCPGSRLTEPTQRIRRNISSPRCKRTVVSGNSVEGYRVGAGSRPRDGKSDR
jgi:hypothetical protein